MFYTNFAKSDVFGSSFMLDRIVVLGYDDKFRVEKQEGL